MNADNFPDFLEQHSQLYQMPYEELKSLVLQYPYCQNLWYLLLKKSLLENHRDFDRNLHMAATLSPDRTFLFRQIRKIKLSREVKESYELNEDFLELKDLNELRAGLEEVVPEKPVEEEQKQSDRLEIDPGPPVPDEEIPAPAFSRPTPQPDVSEQEEETEKTANRELSDESNNETTEEVDGSIPTAPPPLRKEESSPVVPPVQVVPSEGLLDAMGDVIDICLEQSMREPAPAPEPLAQPYLPDESLLLDLISLANLPLPDILPELDKVAEQAPEKSIPTDKEETEKPTSPEEALPKAEAPSTNEPKTSPEEPEEADPAPNQPRPVPKESFSSWLKQFQSPQVGTQLNQILETERKVRKEKKKKKKKKKKSIAKVLAEQSVQEHDIASETLAWLLAEQGHYRKALHTYELLLEKDPGRADYFEGKIRELKKKLK